MTGAALLLAATTLAAPCAPPEAERPLQLAPLLQPGAQPAAQPAAGHHASGDYRHLLARTPLGWASRPRWCVWVEPGADTEPERRWLGAVEAALEAWAMLLPIERVQDPAAAQIRLLRRRPPLRFEASGRSRASNGRAVLQLRAVRRQGQWRAEPLVEVLISPGQRAAASQATALHELGHAFGLWGHSDQPGDALTAVPGADPVLRPSPRDRATLLWLRGRGDGLGGPLPLPLTPR
jgi:predicted Zn-dependent protease